MTRNPAATMLLAAAASVLLAIPAAALPPSVPFDDSRHVIGLDVTVKGTPLFMILDTGVDPSVIDIKRAEALKLPVQRNAGGEASGEGNAATARVFPASIDGLALGGRAFPAIDALATDMSDLSHRYGRALDGVLGFSFLQDKTVLIDYPRHTLHILTGAAEATPLVQACIRHWSVPLRSFKADTIPVIADFHFGDATAPVSLDTGSNGTIALYQAALDLQGMRAALSAKGEIETVGARGEARSKTYTLNEPVGFGPFSLPAGEIVTLRPVKGSANVRVGNVGNRIFEAMKLKLLLDYRARQMTFYGDCG
jgi:hypothetical protein